MARIKVAVVQAAPVAFDLDRSIERIRRLTADAAAKGAQLVLFPEAFLGGYPKGMAFGTVVGDRTYAGREEFRRYCEAAIHVPGPAVAALSDIALANSIQLVIGVIERDGGTLYCTVLFFAADGQYLGKHRKLVPTAAERSLWGRGDGATLPVFETPIGRLGAVICWENYMPLLRTAMYMQGIELYCAPTVDDRERWTATMRHIALEGRCFVLSACQFVTRKDFPSDVITSYDGDSDAIMIRGGSCIVAPDGSVLAGPEYDREVTHVAEIDTDDIVRGKMDFDAVGHYSRPDVFQLSVHKPSGKKDL